MHRTAKKLFVAVTLELMSKSTGLITEGHKACLDIILLERFEAKCPVVAGGAVNKYQSQFEAANRSAVPKCDVHMDDIPVLRMEPVDGLTTWGFLEW